MVQYRILSSIYTIHRIYHTVQTVYMYIYINTIIQSKAVRLYSTCFLWLGPVWICAPALSLLKVLLAVIFTGVSMTHEITGRRSTLESKLNQILTCSSCQDPIKHHKNLPSNLSNLSSEKTTNLHRWLLGRAYPSPQGSHSKTHQLDPSRYQVSPSTVRSLPRAHFSCCPRIPMWRSLEAQETSWKIHRPFLNCQEQANKLNLG